APAYPGMTDRMKEIIRKGRARTTALYAEVYARHFSDAQLQALFDFRNSEMGRSILATRHVVNEEAGRRNNAVNKLLRAEEREQEERCGVALRRADEDEKDPGD